MDGVSLGSDAATRSEFWRSVRRLFLSGAHCDLRLVCGGGEGGDPVRCHRLVLAALSPTLRRALLDASAGDGADGDVVVQLPHSRRADVAAAVQAAYAFLEGGEESAAAELGSEEARRGLGIDLEAFSLSGVKAEEEESGSDWLDDYARDDVDRDPRGSRKKRRGRKPRQRSKRTRKKCEEGLEDEGLKEEASGAQVDWDSEEEEPVPKSDVSLLAPETYDKVLTASGRLSVAVSPDLEARPTGGPAAFRAVVGVKRLGPEELLATPLAFRTQDDPLGQLIKCCNAARPVLGLSVGDLAGQAGLIRRLGPPADEVRQTRFGVRKKVMELPRDGLEAMVQDLDKSDLVKRGSAKPRLKVESGRVDLTFVADLSPAELDGLVILQFDHDGQVVGEIVRETEATAVDLMSSLLEIWSDGDNSAITSQGMVDLYYEAVEKTEQYSLGKRLLEGNLSEEDRLNQLAPIEECSLCGEVFPIQNEEENEDFARHWKSHFRASKMKQHRKASNGNRPAKQKKFTHKSSPKEGRVCETCGLECATPRMLYRHKFNKHTERRCKFCPLVATGTLALVSHMRRCHRQAYTGHDKTPAVCDHCGKRLGSVDSMRRHVLMLHTAEGEKPHRCPRCPRGFPNPSALRAHLTMAHVKNRPFACRAEGCAVAYNDNASLHTHERKVHGMHSKSKRARRDEANSESTA